MTVASQAILRAPGLLSLDVLRGLTIAFMILVNYYGNEAAAYWPLKHAAWNGFTSTGLVFPTFLFLLGVSIVFSTESRLAQGATRQSIFLHSLCRSLILFERVHMSSLGLHRRFQIVRQAFSVVRTRRDRKVSFRESGSAIAPRNKGKSLCRSRYLPRV